MELTFPEGFVIIALEMEPFSLNAFQIGGAEVCSFPGRLGCRGRPPWEGASVGGAVPWEPQALCVDTGPLADTYAHSCDLRVFLAIPGGGH